MATGRNVAPRKKGTGKRAGLPTLLGTSGLPKTPTSGRVPKAPKVG